MRVFTEEETNKIVDMYQAGFRIDKIAKELKSRSTPITETLKRNGLQIKRSRSKNRFLNEHYFDNIDSNRKAYYLGILFTDGSIIKDPEGRRAPSVALELSMEDYEVIFMLRDELLVDSGVSYHNRAGHNETVSFRVRSSLLAESLSKYGIVPNKTYNTDNLPLIDSEYLPCFIRGLIDGDGSIYQSRGRWHISFCSHSKNICEEFENIVTKLIDKPTHMAVQCSNNVYRVTYNGKWAKKVASTIYTDTDFGMARKKKLALMVAGE